MDNSYKSYMMSKLGISEASLKPVDPEFSPNSDELSMGIKHELEHTDDPNISKIIATQHLQDDPNYYSRLAKCGIKEDGIGNRLC